MLRSQQNISIIYSYTSIEQKNMQICTGRTSASKKNQKFQKI